MSRRLLTTRQAATTVGVAPATLRGWLHRGLLNRYGNGRNPSWDLHELVKARDTVREQLALQAPRQRHAELSTSLDVATRGGG